MPILGILASSIQASKSTSYESIATVNVAAGQTSASITFSGIPSNYKHLQIRCIARGTATNATQNNIELRFNSDSGSNYTTHFFTGNGASVSAAWAGTGTIIYAGQHANATSGTSIYAPSIIDILDYKNTNKYKTTRSLYGIDRNGSGQINFVSGLWMSTSAVTSIFLQTGGPNGNFDQYSSFALYGIRG